MDAISFVYWLQGYLELSGEDATLNSDQIKMIKDHLALVLEKKTPKLSDNKLSSSLPIVTEPPSNTRMCNPPNNIATHFC